MVGWARTASSALGRNPLRRSNTLSIQLVNDSIKMIIYKFIYLNRPGEWDTRRETSNKLTTSRCSMCAVIDIIRNLSAELRRDTVGTSDLRCQVRDLTTTNSRVHASELAAESKVEEKISLNESLGFLWTKQLIKLSFMIFLFTSYGHQPLCSVSSFSISMIALKIDFFSKRFNRKKMQIICGWKKKPLNWQH